MEKTCKKNKSCFAWGFGCLGIFFLILSLSLNGVLFVITLASLSSESESSGAYLSETIISFSDSSSDKIALIPISGVIQHQEGSGDFFGASGPSAEITIEQIRQAVRDPSVKAIVLDVSSPGGTVSASDVIYNEIVKAKESGKPIVSYFGEIAASGAYYVSAPTDYIIAEPSSLVGSIGVIFSGVNYTDLLGKIGVREQVYKSGEHKDIFSSTRYPTESDDEIILSLVRDSYDQFTSIVKENRPVKSSDYGIAFDGRIFSARQSLDIGLIDSIGYREDAFLYSAELAGITEYSLVSYEEPVSFGSIFSGLGVIAENASVVDKLPELMQEGQPKLMYLWR